MQLKTMCHHDPPSGNGGTEEPCPCWFSTSEEYAAARAAFYNQAEGGDP